MDRPKSEVSWLESSPPDIWAYFAEYLAGEHILRLMMTGATLLSKRLKSPKVVKSVKLGRDYLIFKSFPRFLNDFPSLEKLTIKSPSDEWSDSIRLTIESIPSGVRNLKLDGNFGKELFLQNGSILKMNEHLPHLEILDIEDTILTNDSWMVHSPQSLTKVNLDQWNGDVELPSSLIDFEATNVYLSANSFVSIFPLRLEKFVVYDTLRGVELILPLLPPTTRKLCLGHNTGVNLPPQTFLKLLPRELTSLKDPDTLNIDFVGNPEFISLLPPKLTKLELNPKVPSSAWPLLPQRLTALTLKYSLPVRTTVTQIAGDHVKTREVYSFPFSTLPMTLTSFSMIGPFGERYLCSPSTTLTFPPNLVELYIPCTQLSPEAAQRLPSSLTYLQLGNLCERVCEHLPKGLKTFTSCATLVSPNLIKFLPRSITDLGLEFAGPESPWFDPNTGESLGSVSEHPDYPIHEKCLSNRVDWDDTCLLPPNLTDLRLTGGATLGDLFFLHQPLLKLKELAFHEHAKKYSDLSISLLPRNLTFLDIESLSKITSKSFSFLPRGLVLLNIRHAKSIFDCDIQHLPRTLTALYMNRAIHLTDLCIADLPPNLKELDLDHNVLITPACVPGLPFALKSSMGCSYATFRKWSIEDGKVRQRE